MSLINGVKFWDDQAKHGPDAAVIDPNDTFGYKNNYIAILRNQLILDALFRLPEGSTILDFGCGSGNVSKLLADNGFATVGIDISMSLLKYTHRHDLSNQSIFMRYDGRSLPFRSTVFNGCVTYVVLNYFVNSAALDAILKDIYRVLKPGAFFVFIEQIRAQNTLSEDGIKMQRTVHEFVNKIQSAGFQKVTHQIVRRGHFPLIYLIRYGILPISLFPAVAKVEKWLGKVFPKVRFDYAETLFIGEK